MTSPVLTVPNSIFLSSHSAREIDAQKFGRIRAGLSPTIAITMILLGIIVNVVLGSRDMARFVWFIGLTTVGIPVVWRTVRAVLRAQFNTDVIASLSVIAATILGQPLAGLIVVLMQTGGEALERFAERRASVAVRDLENAAPRIAHLIREGGEAVDVPAVNVKLGDLFLLRPGDLIPCDGVVVSGNSEIDASQLTGEAIPVSAQAGISVLSGSLNLHGLLTVRATAAAAESQYARIVEMVRIAQASKAPLQRLADRYAVWFTPVTLAVCLATFAMSRNWLDVLSVLVVATPCPLILATPVALIGGINRAARERIMIRNAAALESLSKARTAVFDKTGTLTVGKPKVHRVWALAGYTEDQVFSCAAAVENGSSHLLARVIAEQAMDTYGSIPEATRHWEAPGQGVTGLVGSIEVAVGGRAFVSRHATIPLTAFSEVESAVPVLRAYVLLNGKPAGSIEFADSLRPELLGSLDELKELGFNRRVLLSGDSIANTMAVGRLAGMNEMHGDLLPAQKAAFVTRYRAAGEVVMMVGDGTNDAPALSSADVGIAMSGHGGGVTSEAADVVVLVDDLAKVPEAVRISRRTMRLAHQSIGTGLVLSGIAMIFAAYGFIPPTSGALLQEAIDVAVIINALRASWS